MYHVGYDPKLGADRPKFNSEFLAGKSGKSDTVKFNYIWDSDGAESNATVTLNYKLPLERSAPIGSYDELEEPDDIHQAPYPANTWSPYIRYGEFQTLHFVTHREYASAQSDHEQALWDSVNVGWLANDKPFYEKVKAMSGIVGLIPQCKIAATAIGIYADIYTKFSPHGEVIGVTRKYRLFKKAYNMGAISPYPDHLPSEAEMGRYMWAVSRRQLYTVKLFADDLYGKDGYLGQKLGFEYDLFSYDERQSFKLQSGGGS
jgi:hypothetical protein